jgi:hypothetical protein
MGHVLLFLNFLNTMSKLTKQKYGQFLKDNLHEPKIFNLWIRNHLLDHYFGTIDTWTLEIRMDFK